MKATIKEVRETIERINKNRGFNATEWNTIGAVKMGQDICGITIYETLNAHGGVKRLSTYGMTKAETLTFLYGMLTK